MKLNIEIPEFSSESGIKYKWEDNFSITTELKDGCISIIANREGLISLANHLLNLAQNVIPVGYHMHFDEYNSLETDSIELIIQKI